MAQTIVANWKMNGSTALVEALIPSIATFAAQSQIAHELVICPPTALLSSASRCIRGSFLSLGAQDCSPHTSGAYTGETSASMLAELGCRYVILGHSERRIYHGETNEIVSAKATQAIKSGLIPIICIGETKSERNAGEALHVIATQLASSIPTQSGDFLLAYEPVWAIGSGVIPSCEDIATMHQHIHACAGKNVKILYGGSVKAANASSILATEGVSGLLVGGASIILDEFCGIMTA